MNKLCHTENTERLKDACCYAKSQNRTDGFNFSWSIPIENLMLNHHLSG